MKTKICCICKQEKLLAEFSSSNRCKTCDVQRLENWKERQGKSLKMYHAGKSSAHCRGIEHRISYKEYLVWFSKQEKVCYYCNTSLDFANRRSSNRRSSNIATTDRIDNEKGYTIDNIALSCLRCNMIKGLWLTAQQMTEIAAKYFRQSAG